MARKEPVNRTPDGCTRSNVTYSRYLGHSMTPQQITLPPDLAFQLELGNLCLGKRQQFRQSFPHHEG